MDRAPARRSVPSGVRLGRAVRDARRRDRGGFREASRSTVRALLDRGARWRGRRLDILRQEIEEGREATPFVRRAIRPSHGHRHASRRRVHSLRSSGRLSKDDALDAESSHRSAARVRAGWLQARTRRATPQLRRGPRRADVGDGTVKSKCRFLASSGMTTYLSSRGAKRRGICTSSYGCVVSLTLGKRSGNATSEPYMQRALWPHSGTIVTVWCP